MAGAWARFCGVGMSLPGWRAIARPGEGSSLLVVALREGLERATGFSHS